MQYDEVDAEKKQSPTVELRVTNTKCDVYVFYTSIYKLHSI